MPEMTGRELAKKLRSTHEHLRCVFMSGYPVDVMAEHGVVDEAVAFLPKPFIYALLSKKLREVMEKGSRAPDAPTPS